jgi:hypothetical protein
MNFLNILYSMSIAEPAVFIACNLIAVIVCSKCFALSRDKVALLLAVSSALFLTVNIFLLSVQIGFAQFLPLDVRRVVYCIQAVFGSFGSILFAIACIKYSSKK